MKTTSDDVVPGETQFYKWGVREWGIVLRPTGQNGGRGGGESTALKLVPHAHNLQPALKVESDTKSRSLLTGVS